MQGNFYNDHSREKDKEKEDKNHIINVTDRRQISMTGIESVTSFSPREIVLNMPSGKVTVQGEDLKITEFCKTTGRFTAIGKIFGVRYGGGENRWSKIFR